MHPRAARWRWSEAVIAFVSRSGIGDWTWCLPNRTWRSGAQNSRVRSCRNAATLVFTVSTFCRRTRVATSTSCGVRDELNGVSALLPGKQRDDLVFRNGPAYQVTLDLIALQTAEQVPLRRFFHTLRDDLEMQRMRHRDDCGDDGQVVGVLVDLRNEGPIDLEVVDRQSRQVAQR